MPALDRFYRDNKDEFGFLVVALSDTEIDIRGLVHKNGYSFPIVMDESGIGGAYAIESIPTEVFVDASGTIRRVQVGAMTADQLEEEARKWKSGPTTTLPGVSFPDVPSDHPYAEAIEGMAAAGIIGGYENGLFGPSDSVKRAQFAKMIVGSMGIAVSEGLTSPFIDLGWDDPAKLYPHEYVAAAYHNNITTGVTPTAFLPYGPIARAQMITMIVRAAQNLQPGLLTIPPPGYAAQVGGFSPTHAENLRVAEFNGLLAGLVGYGASWDPWATATRGECAEVLWTTRTLER